MSKIPALYTVKVSKLVHGGQALGELENGQKAFVWGALPGETVQFRVTKKRKDFVEGVAAGVIKPSSDRVEPRDAHYMSTSPWQILSEPKETFYKKEILKETFRRAGVDFSGEIETTEPPVYWQYRNKMEYSFYGDESGLHLALFNRGTHAKQVVEGSSIARPEIDEAAQKIVSILEKNQIRAGILKSLILRCNQDGEVVAALFVKNQEFPQISELDGSCKGLVIIFSNPKSPASVRTKDLYSYGDISLSDTIVGTDIGYDVFSFFQVNVPVFESAVHKIAEMAGDLPAIDMYSGVGSIGIAIPSVETLVEIDDSNVLWAEKNAKVRQDLKIVNAPSEKTLDIVDSNHVLIVDPPRAGLHIDLTNIINTEKPPKIIYLSCNPSTQARDIAALQENYKLERLAMYNFFPRTPHIESLALLVRQ